MYQQKFHICELSPKKQQKIKKLFGKFGLCADWNLLPPIKFCPRGQPPAILVSQAILSHNSYSLTKRQITVHIYLWLLVSEPLISTICMVDKYRMRQAILLTWLKVSKGWNFWVLEKDDKCRKICSADVFVTSLLFLAVTVLWVGFLVEEARRSKRNDDSLCIFK